jgi:two-component system cell cycle response regulator
MEGAVRILLIDPADERRGILARRLRAQGYAVDETSEATAGADLALRAPPACVVADLWMPAISGVQLCRLLRAEAATVDVPVVLCGERDEPRDRFWAERAGAAAYVMKGRTGDLFRAVSRAVAGAVRSDGFFVQLSGGSMDIRDRLARHLDAALFESVLAAELRALASAGSFERLFDRFAQFVSQVTRYRWMALTTSQPPRFAIHHHPASGDAARHEAMQALGLPHTTPVFQVIEDEDASAEEGTIEPIVCDVHFDRAPVARFACATSEAQEEDARSLAAIIGRELGGSIKMAVLVEESQRLAATDSLTGLMNRRAFAIAMRTELSRCTRHAYPLSFLLLDVDHFKQINDRYSHAAGDRVLAALGELLVQQLRESDLAGRWGGEEFVVACTSTNGAGSLIAAERLRMAIEAMVVTDDKGVRIPVTASIGAATWRNGESLEALIDRADRAMYASKTAGRNRVTRCADDHDPLSDVA